MIVVGPFRLGICCDSVITGQKKLIYPNTRPYIPTPPNTNHPKAMGNQTSLQHSGPTSTTLCEELDLVVLMGPFHLGVFNDPIMHTAQLHIRACCPALHCVVTPRTL